MNILKMILNNRWLKITLAVIALQQILVALGTFLMGSIAAEASVRGLNVLRMSGLVLCLILSGSLFHYLLQWASIRSNKSVLLNYFKQYFVVHYNQPTHWRNQESRAGRHDVMSRTGQDTITQTLDFIIDTAATTMNIVFNTFSIILVTDKWIGVSIAVAGAVGLLVIHLADRQISNASQNEMLTDNRLNAHLACSWDNILLGNKLFFSRWSNRFERLFDESKKSAFLSVQKRDKIVSLAGFLTTSVVVGTTLGLAWINRLDAGLVVALLIMLPRSLQIVMHLQIIQSYWARWKSLREKLVLTEESVAELKTCDLSGYIQLEKINLNLESLKNKKSGRFTIVGSNGTGKSTLLLQLKEEWGERAIYLPAHHQLELENAGISLSTGQTTLSLINEIAKSNFEFLLLDEWDANLSPENRTFQNKILDKLSLDRVVVEVRHVSV